MLKEVTKKDVFVIVAPTATGKSGLAIELAKKINGEIISADSMQIYKKLNVGTAKVTKKEADGIKHHLINICDISDIFSVAEYKQNCYNKINEILKKNKAPIIVGGTGLYINAVVNNMKFDKEQPNNNEDYEHKSNEELIKILADLDKETLISIDLKNRKRLIRAINMAKLGSLKSEKTKRNDLWKSKEAVYNFFVIYIDIPRDILYDKIEKRIDSMNKRLLLEEAKLIHNIRDLNYTAVQAIGYKELFPYIDNQATLNECLNKLKISTRHYAKRQITWFKKLNKDLIINGIETKEKQIEEIIKKYNERKK